MLIDLRSESKDNALMKFKTVTLALLFIAGSAFSLYSFDIYKSKKLDVEMDLLLGVDYSYEATLLPGRAGFELTESKIGLEGEYLDKMKVNISVDFSDTEVDGDNVQFLKDAYGQYNFFDALRLRLGRFEIPFGEENSNGKMSRPNMYHSEASDLIVPGRSVGIRLSGKKIFNDFSYSLGAYNSSGTLYVENETGHHIFTGKLQFKRDFFKTGYEILYSTDEVFSQGLFIDFDIAVKKNMTFRFFSEYIEQRYYNYHWNHSIFTSVALRINDIEPLIYFDYYDERVGYDGDEDKWVAGLGFNSYFLNDKLKLMVDLHTNYYYSLQNVSNLKFYDNKLTVKMILGL